MLSAAVKGGRPPTPGAPGVCAVTDQAAVLVASNKHTHTRSIKLAYHNEKTHTFEVFQKYEKIFVEKIIVKKENIL